MEKTPRKGAIVPFKHGVAALDRRARKQSPAYAALAGAVDVMTAEELRVLSTIISNADNEHRPSL